VREMDVEQFGGDVQMGPVDPDHVRNAMNWVRIKVQFTMTKAQQERRTEDVRIRREYLERAFEAQRLRLGNEELKVQDRVDSGEQGAAGRLAIIRDHVQQTELRQEERMRALDRLVVARGGDVRHLASIVVLPLPGDSDVHRLLRSDPVVEKVAMDF